MARKRPALASGNKDVAEEAFSTVNKKHGGAVAAARLDKRASGGRVGADKSPLAASSSKHPFSSAKKG